MSLITRIHQKLKRESLIKEMFATVGENAWVEPPVYFSYGSNIHIGRNFMQISI